MQRYALASTLALANEARGDHSWGAADALTAEGWRGLGPVRGAPIGSFAERPAVMLHTRWATTGKVTLPNCHPLKHGPITLAHNGVIANHLLLAKRYGRTCDVDSQHIAIHLAEGLPLDELEGYGAIEWMDERLEPGTVRLCRFEEGDLSVRRVLTAKGQLVVWSSDRRHLRDALRAAGFDKLESEEVVLKDNAVYDVYRGEIYKTKTKLCITPRITSCWDDYWLSDGLDRSWKPLTGNQTKDREDVARSLGLTQVDVDVWVDESGVPIEVSELDSLIEMENESMLEWIKKGGVQ